jgi:hypothetical protein
MSVFKAPAKTFNCDGINKHVDGCAKYPEELGNYLILRKEKCPLCSPNVPYHFHRNLSLVSILGHMKPIHNLTTCHFKILHNINLPSTPRYS